MLWGKPSRNGGSRSGGAVPPGFSQTGQKLVGLCTTCFHGYSIVIGQSCRCGQYFCAAVCRPSAVISDIAGQHVADEWTMQTMPVRGWGWCFAFLPFLPQSMSKLLPWPNEASGDTSSLRSRTNAHPRRNTGGCEKRPCEGRGAMASVSIVSDGILWPRNAPQDP